jgi:hypothetical protein
MVSSEGHEYHRDTQQKAKEHFTIVIRYLDRMLTGVRKW